MDDKSVPIIAWDVHEDGRLLWRALPWAAIVISPSEAPVIGVRYIGKHVFAFTDSEKLLLPDPPVSNGVAKITVRRAELAAAPRVVRNPENDPDDLDYDPAGAIRFP